VESPHDQLHKRRDGTPDAPHEKSRGGVIDLFCGAGGLSYGFLLEGYEIIAGVDIDECCRYPFETNNFAPFIRRDVAELGGEELIQEYKSTEPKILVGCAPCQPFSKYSQGREDSRWSLLDDFSRLIAQIRPDIVSMENVPQLVKYKGGKLFERFLYDLNNNGYKTTWSIANCSDFGVPQSRSRLVLLASLHGKPDELEKTCEPGSYRTVREAIGRQPAIEAGAVDPKDSLHRASALSEQNLRRIKASKPGGTWREWPEELVTDCHTKPTGRGYSSVYGRMAWDEVAPTITTQFYGFGNGRFGHPEQQRAISLREGALLQTFPRGYDFVEPGSDVHMKTLGRLIGNAVPVELGQAIARAVRKHVEKLGL